MVRVASRARSGAGRPRDSGKIGCFPKKHSSFGDLGRRSFSAAKCAYRGEPCRKILPPESFPVKPQGRALPVSRIFGPSIRKANGDERNGFYRRSRRSRRSGLVFAPFASFCANFSQTEEGGINPPFFGALSKPECPRDENPRHSGSRSDPENGLARLIC